jgi:hypothetical protein
MIKDYKVFKGDLLIEKLLLESIIYFSPDLRKMLNRIDSEVAKELLNSEGQDIKKDITFIDIDNREGYVTFKTMRNVKKQLDKYPKGSSANSLDISFDNTVSDYLYNKTCLSWSETRSPLGVGRLINSILPGKFDSKQIEDFTNKFKMRQTKSTEEFRIVEGDDIAFWYSSQNYYEESYTLGSSCMREKDDHYFRIYTLNPEVCKMLVLLDEDDEGEMKLKGRALLWKPKDKRIYPGGSELDFEWFLDRQYAINDAEILKFREYADKEGCPYKTRNTHSDLDEITYKGIVYSIKMSVKLGKYKGDYDYRSYPFVDTFRRYDPNSGILYNDSDSGIKEQYLLNSTDGDYEETTSGNVWSNYHEEDIEEDSAVWSDSEDSYIRRDSAVHIDNGSRINYGWYPEYSDDLSYDGWNGNYIHMEDSIYSDHYSYSLLDSEVVSAIVKLDDNGDCDDDPYYVHEDDVNFISLNELSGLSWYKEMNDKFNWTDVHQRIDKKLLRTDKDGDWSLKLLDVKVFRTESPLKGMAYLSELDAIAFGLEIDRNDSKILGREDYESDLISRSLVEILIRKFETLLKYDQKSLNLDIEQEWDHRQKSILKSIKYEQDIKNRISRLRSIIQ